MTYPNGYNFLQMELDTTVPVRRAIYWLSSRTFGFTPTLRQINYSTYTPGQFVIYIDLPIWPAGSPHTTANYAAAIRALNKQYSVGIGMLYVSVEVTP